MIARVCALAPGIALALSLSTSVAGAQQPVDLAVDATGAPRKVLHAREMIPVSAGPCTLLYPEWIPGEHAPTGPVLNLAGLRLTVDGRPLTWRRDDVNMYAIHCDVPAGATRLDADYDYLLPSGARGFTAAACSTSELVVLNWNLVVLYPQGKRSDDLTYSASLTLPAGWKHATSLPIESESPGRIQFKQASLTTLIDSPLIAGKHFRAIELASDSGRTHEVDIVADSDAVLNLPARVVDGFKQLVAETGSIFGGARHYRRYRFLLTLSDHVSSFGEEHHESSDDRAPERGFADDSGRRDNAILLPHEFFHSWNGKYRRPAGLATRNYNDPMKDELLWVYEGLTDYYGGVLAVRTGLFSQEEYRDYLASFAAALEATDGRKWRSLADTAVAAPMLLTAPREWAFDRRGTDFYPEMDLVWLEADAIIRQRTNGQRSLDDFCRRFHGGESTGPQVKAYNLGEVLASLNEVTPYDWKGFVDKRIYQIAPHAPIGGIEACGWRLVYNDKPNVLTQNAEGLYHFADFSTTLGLTLGDGGAIVDVRLGGPAGNAGMSPGEKMIGINGRKYTAELLHAAIAAAKGGASPIELLVEDGEYYHTYRLDYHDGERFPHLERDPSKPDLLTAVASAQAKP